MENTPKAQNPLAAWLQRVNPNTKRTFVSLGALILLFIFFSIVATSRFLSEINIINLLQSVVTYSIIGFGMTIVVVGGGTDLSAGAAMALAGLMCIYMLSRNVPIVLSILLAIMVGVAMGLLNGFSVMVLEVLPFIATLGTQWVFRGLTNVITDGRPIFTNMLDPEVARKFYLIGGGRIFHLFNKDQGFSVTDIENGFLRVIARLPNSVIIALVYGIFMYFLLAKTPIGRKIYACGSNVESARLSGINVVKTRMFAYVMCSISATIAGIIVTSRVSSAQTAAGLGIELEGIAAAVLGGVALSGGEGGIINTVIGAFIIGILRNGLNLMGLNSFWQMVIIGFVIVFAVAGESYRNRKFS